MSSTIIRRAEIFKSHSSAFSPDKYMEQEKFIEPQNMFTLLLYSVIQLVHQQQVSGDLESLTNSQPLPVHRIRHSSVSTFPVLLALQSQIGQFAVQQMDSVSRHGS